jgi:hypothetical protein
MTHDYTDVNAYTIEDVIPGRATSLYDMDGHALFDGDTVENFNIPDPWPRIGEVRLCHLGRYIYWSGSGASIQTLSADQHYGVRKLSSLDTKGEGK